MVTFIYQTPPTYSYKEVSSWLTAAIIAGTIVLLLIAFGIIIRRRPVLG
ncbi:MAG: hypothetical protein SWK76_12455 [Actinomycetota bacterium]|nr:hypothetical protein [Actinomycetota bacterium]